MNIFSPPHASCLCRVLLLVGGSVSPASPLQPRPRARISLSSRSGKPTKEKRGIAVLRTHTCIYTYRNHS